MPEHNPPWIQSQFQHHHNDADIERHFAEESVRPSDRTAFNNHGPQFTVGVMIDRAAAEEFSPQQVAGQCNAPYAAGPSFVQPFAQGLFRVCSVLSATLGQRSQHLQLTRLHRRQFLRQAGVVHNLR